MSSRRRPGTDAVETCLWLAELASVRPGVSLRLVSEYGGLEEALARPRAELATVLAGRRRGRRAAQQSDEGDGATWRAALARLAPAQSLRTPPGGITVAITDRAYPAWLAAITDPPPVLFILGGRDADEAAARWRALAARPKAAVVGCRKPTAYGLDMAAGIAAGLDDLGVVVVSGLARGIDAAAHRGALSSARTGVLGAGRSEDGGRLSTVAVMGCGADVCYPASHRTLYAAVRRSGLIVSEFVWRTRARGWRFPARNRVMAGLCHVVVVVEGTERSGALITVERALEGGREVLAVPGEAGRPQSQGPHALLRLGAGMCESAECVEVALRGISGSAPEVLKAWSTALDRSRGQGGHQTHAEVGGGADLGSADEPTAPGSADEPTGPGSADEPAGPGSADERPGQPAAGAAAEAERLPRTSVLEALDRSPATVEALVRATGLSAAEVLVALAAAEIDGDAAAGPGGVYRAVRGRARRRNLPSARRTCRHGDDTRSLTGEGRRRSDRA